MNVRIVRHGTSQRTDLYGGVDYIESDGEVLYLCRLEGRPKPLVIGIEVMDRVAEILLDEEPGDCW